MKNSIASFGRALLFAVLLPFTVHAQTTPLACDVDRDRDVDRLDVAAITAARNQPASGPTDPRDFDRDGTITVNDARACTLRCTLPGCASPATNRAPTANAGPDQVVFPGVTVTLNGTGSTDPDGNALTYRWTLAVKPAGSAAVLGGATSAMPTFVPDRAGDYRVDVVVNDGTVDSAVDSVVVTTENAAPVANAGPDQVVARGATVTLDGTGSTDANGDPLTFQWSFVAFPGGTAPSFLTSGARPMFVAATAGTYRVRLVVSDGRVSSSEDFVVITTEAPPNTPPVAEAGPAQRVALGALVALDGTGSSDADGNPLAYRWSLTSRPSGSAAALSSATAPTPSFTADRAGNYVVQLIVNDGFVDSAPDTVLVSTTNTPPVANAGPDRVVTQGDTVALDGNGSSDADGDPLTYAWSFTAFAGASAPPISDPNTPTPSFVASAAGLYVVQLVVNDGTVDSPPDTASITVEVRANRAPTAVNDLATTAEDTSVAIPVLGNDTDPDSDPLTVTAVSQPANGTATTNGTTVTFAPALDFNGQTSFTYSISDGRGGTSSATVLVTVTPSNDPPVARADAASTTSGTAVDIPVLTNDEDVDGDPLTIQSVGTPSNGTATIVGSQVRYAPAAGFAGPATFTYTISDGRGGTASATVTVTVGALPSLSIADVSVTEGDSGTTFANFVATLSAASGATVTVAYGTADGTASGTSDFGSASGVLTFAPGETTKTIGVVVNGDTTVEPNETFFVNLSAPTNATLADAQAQGTIVNDDQTVLVTVAATTPSVPEQGSGTGLLTFTRTGATTAPLVITFTRGGAASASSDYADFAPSLTIPAGAASVTLPIAPSNDALVEGDETVTVTVTAAAGYTPGAAASATVTIVDDDFRPTVTIAASTASVPEQGPGSGVFTITRAGGGGSDAASLTVALTAGGTASGGGDYFSLPPSVIIPANATSVTVTVPPIDDTAVEGNETVVASLAADASYVVGTPSAATVTIVDDDFRPTVTIAATAASVPEQGPGTATFTVTRAGGGGSNAAALVVSFTVAGAATAGADYGAIGTSVTIPANQASAAITITPIDDTNVEGDETVVVALAAAGSYTVGTPSSAAVTIVDNDFQQTVTVVASTPSVPEQGPGTGVFTFTRSGPATDPLTVSFQVSGVAISGSDFQGIATTVAFAAGQSSTTLAIVPTDDTNVEGNESVSITLTSGIGYVVGTPSNATVTIVDDDATPTVTIAATTPSVAEQGPGTGRFAITRAGAGGAIASPLTVAFAVGGTASNGADYASLGGSVTIPANATTATVDVTPSNDVLVEGSETVVLTLQSGAGYTLGTPANATVTITDDDTVSIGAANVLVSEGNTGTTNATFTVTLSVSAASAVTVDYATADATATAGSDYTARSGTLTFPAGTTSLTVDVPVLGDGDVEASETFRLELSNPSSGATVGTPFATGTIQNDDQPRQISISDVTLDEGNAGTTPFVFTVTLDQAAAGTVTVDYSAVGVSAAVGTDFQAASGTLTFAPGETSRTITVNVTGDAVQEGDETFNVQLSNVNVNGSIVDAVGVGTIRNDDVNVTLTLSPNPLLVPIGQTRQMTVTRSPAAGAGGAVVTLSSGTPTAATVPASVTIPQGATQATFDVTAVGAINAQTTISASGGGAATPATAFARVTGGALTVGARRVGLNLQTSTFVALPAAPPAPVDVTVTAQPGVLVSLTPTGAGAASVTIPSVSTTSGNTVYVHGITSGTAPVLTASAPGYDDGTAVVNVDPSGFAFYAVSADPTSVEAFAANQSFQVWSIRLNADGTFADWQNVRAGFTTNVVVTSSNPANGTIVNSPLVFGPNTATQNAVFDPIAAGATQIAIVQPGGFTETPTATFNARTRFTVNLVGSAAVFSPASLDVGVNLQATFSARLSAPPPVPTDFVLSVPPGSGVLLSTSATAVGTQTLTFPAITDASFRTVYVQGTAVGTVNVTASAAGFAPSTFPVNVTPSGFAFYAVQPPVAIDRSAANRDFQIWSIRLNANGSFATWQNVRPGAGTVLTVTNSNPAAGTLVNSAIAFAGGASFVNVTFDPIAVGTTTLALVQPSGYTATTNADFNARTQFAVDVTGLPQVSVADATVIEGDAGTRNLVFTLTLDAPLAANGSVFYQTLSGTAFAGIDFTNTSGTLTVPAGVTSVTLAVPVIGDTTVEADETFVVRLTSPSANVAIGQSEATGTIQNDDVLSTVTIADASVVEGNAGATNLVFTVTATPASNGPVTVFYQAIGGTAGVSSDFTSTSGTLTIPANATSATIAVPILGDTSVEPDETFRLRLQSPNSNGQFAGSATFIEATGTIVNDDVLSTITIADASVVEGNAGTTNLVFTVSATPTSNGPITVFYQTIGGTAGSGTDFTNTSGTLTIPAGASSATVSVPILGDTTVEPSETVRLRLQSPNSNGQFAGGVNFIEGTGTILDDDVLSTVTIADASLVEGNAGTTNLVFTVTATPASNGPVTVFYQTIGATAVSGTDFTNTSGTLTIPAGATSATIAVPILGDTSVEPNETFRLRLQSPNSNGQFAGGATFIEATGTIVNDDVLSTITIADASVVEGNAGTTNLVFTVSATPASNGPVTVFYQTIGGTAGSGTDFTNTSGTLTIPAGANSATVSVPILGDTTVEANETFRLRLQSPNSNGQFAGGATFVDGTGTIINDD